MEDISMSEVLVVGGPCGIEYNLHRYGTVPTPYSKRTSVYGFDIDKDTVSVLPKGMPKETALDILRSIEAEAKMNGKGYVRVRNTITGNWVLLAVHPNRLIADFYASAWKSAE